MRYSRVHGALGLVTLIVAPLFIALTRCSSTSPNDGRDTGSLSRGDESCTDVLAILRGVNPTETGQGPCECALHEEDALQCANTSLCGSNWADAVARFSCYGGPGIPTAQALYRCGDYDTLVIESGDGNSQYYFYDSSSGMLMGVFGGDLRVAGCEAVNATFRLPIATCTAQLLCPDGGDR